jgi:2-amino-4-hydroxy-6-hydroxymethyldihydropteridine diphosphokinase
VTAEPQATPAPRRVLLGLGSNLGDRRRALREAIECLPNVRAVSGLYETDPVGGPPGQGPYINLVVAIETDASPRQLLGMCHRIESAAGRVRVERWGPRTLDIDILWIDGETVDEPDLSVPHPRLFERRFVLVPLNDVAPDLLPQGWEDVDGWVTPVEPL